MVCPLKRWTTRSHITSP